jgi:Na+-transporting NADH:ubiquinone oxidoreductase subunit NqrB
MTRSLHEIAHGNLIASIRYHLFGPVVFVGMLAGLAGFGAEAISGKKILSHIRWKLWRPALATAAVAWLIYWLVRVGME